MSAHARPVGEPATEPLVSVLTPVYNGERYLAECIESVLGQTYRNWEYVIVNNCSTDGTLEIAERYARRDARIRVHTNDRFVSSLRNHNVAFGQMSAHAQYCKVLHADDWLFPECLSRMTAVAEVHPRVGLVGAYSLHGLTVKCLGLPYQTTIISGRELCRRTLLGDLYLFFSPTSLLIRSDLIRAGDFYNEAYLHADTDACLRVLQHADFGFVHQVLTYVREHKGSISSTVAVPFGTYALAWIDMLKRYGPAYLTPKEYHRADCLRRDDYYRFLGKSVFRLRGRAFWAYHRRGLAQAGEQLRWGRLLGAMAAAGADPFLAPVRALRRTLEFVACALDRRRGGAAGRAQPPAPRAASRPHGSGP
jgi:glycosyltransferase involved in cell wall biosynthesis